MTVRADFGFYQNITTGTTTTVKTGQGALLAIVVNKAVAGDTITIYDSLSGSGTKIGTITFPATLLASQAVFPYFCQFNTGLTIVTSGADDITVVYGP